MKDGSLTITPQHVEANKEVSEQLAPIPATTKTAEEPSQSQGEAAPAIEKTVLATSSLEDAQPAPAEELHKEEIKEEPTTSSPVKTSEAPPIMGSAESPVHEDGSDDATASTVTLKPSPEPEEEVVHSLDHKEKLAQSTEEEIKSENELDTKEVADGIKDADDVSTKETAKDE